ncbi:hypothetical protein AAC387_Pa01g2497 [Persea americana]
MNLHHWQWCHSPSLLPTCMVSSLPVTWRFCGCYDGGFERGRKGDGGSLDAMMVGCRLYVVGAEKGVIVVSIWGRKKMKQLAGDYDGG